MQIVQVSSEILPWSKAGGLGDVSGALPPALAARGHRVVTVAPRYRDYEDVAATTWTGGAWLYGRHHDVRWYHARRDGVDHLFVDHPCFHRSGVYGDHKGSYGDNLFRYALLCRVALQVPELPLPGGPLGEDVVWHANDWHAGLVPVLLDAVMRPAGRFLRSPSILALHNVAHHGAEAMAHFEALDLSQRWAATLELQTMLSPLKGGVATADQLVTVSPTYAQEITDRLGFGLEPLLRARRGDLHGIVNGVGDDWVPSTDPRLPARFSVDDMKGKAINKKKLQQAFGLKVDKDAPLFAFIGRLVHQKGVDLIEAITPALVHHGAQLVMVGSGQPEHEQWMLNAPSWWPGRVGTWVGYDEDRAHLVEAGADAFLMPSRFEPCGLNQLYSLRYGTVPVVHRTGGLNDTVIDAREPDGTGFLFERFDTDGFAHAALRAIRMYHDDKPAWAALQKRGMQQSFSWDDAAASYEQVYEWAQARRRFIAGDPA